MQLAGQGHDYALQLGWGTTCARISNPEVEIAGFDQENATPKYRDAHQALASGDYDAFVMTEMVRVGRDQIPPKPRLRREMGRRGRQRQSRGADFPL